MLPRQEWNSRADAPSITLSNGRKFSPGARNEEAPQKGEERKPPYTRCRCLNRPKSVQKKTVHTPHLKMLFHRWPLATRTSLVSKAILSFLTSSPRGQLF